LKEITNVEMWQNDLNELKKAIKYEWKI
jgi:hypothetical protein